MVLSTRRADAAHSRRGAGVCRPPDIGAAVCAALVQVRPPTRRCAATSPRGLKGGTSFARASKGWLAGTRVRSAPTLFGSSDRAAKCLRVHCATRSWCTDRAPSQLHSPRRMLGLSLHAGLAEPPHALYLDTERYPVARSRRRGCSRGSWRGADLSASCVCASQFVDGRRGPVPPR